MHIDQCLTRLSATKLAPATDRNNYRDLQADIMWRVEDIGTLSHQRDIAIKCLPSGLREPHSRIDRAEEPEGMEDTKETVPSKST